MGSGGASGSAAGSSGSAGGLSSGGGGGNVSFSGGSFSGAEDEGQYRNQDDGSGYSSSGGISSSSGSGATEEAAEPEDPAEVAMRDPYLGTVVIAGLITLFNTPSEDVLKKLEETQSANDVADGVAQPQGGNGQTEPSNQQSTGNENGAAGDSAAKPTGGSASDDTAKPSADGSKPDAAKSDESKPTDGNAGGPAKADDSSDSTTKQ